MLLSKIFNSALISFLIISMAMPVIISSFSIWSNWQPATCMPNNCFCEEVNTVSVLKQPLNTWSSFAFVIVGSYLLWLTITQDKKSRFPKLYQFHFCGVAIIVGIGSAFYHASLVFIGQFTDVFGMYLLATFILIYACQRLFSLSETIAVLLYLLANVFLSYLQLEVPSSRRFLFASVLIIALLLELIYLNRKKPVINVRWFFLGLGLFATAFAIWILDITKIVCSAQSYIQGHAIWHILGGIAIGFLYFYYKSENIAFYEDKPLISP
jgi:hypothetical protein